MSPAQYTKEDLTVTNTNALKVALLLVAVQHLGRYHIYVTFI